MSDYVWYECLLDCGCTMRQDDFKPQPPKEGADKWCDSHKRVVKIKRYSRYSIPLDEYEDMLAQRT